MLSTSVHVDCYCDKATKALYGRGTDVGRPKDGTCALFVRRDMVGDQAQVMHRLRRGCMLNGNIEPNITSVKISYWLVQWQQQFLRHHESILY